MIRVQEVALTSALDSRGLLIAAEFPKQLPFSPTRLFVVSDTPSLSERGGHAHRLCHQFLIVVSGEVLVEYDDDRGTGSTLMSNSSIGLYIPPSVWAKQTYLVEGSSLAVLASETYSAGDYIDDRSEALKYRVECMKS